jgi:hypothetical protein
MTDIRELFGPGFVNALHARSGQSFSLSILMEILNAQEFYGFVSQDAVTFRLFMQEVCGMRNTPDSRDLIFSFMRDLRRVRPTTPTQQLATWLLYLSRIQAQRLTLRQFIELLSKLSGLTDVQITNVIYRLHRQHNPVDGLTSPELLRCVDQWTRNSTALALTSILSWNAGPGSTIHLSGDILARLLPCIWNGQAGALRIANILQITLNNYAAVAEVLHLGAGWSGGNPDQLSAFIDLCAVAAPGWQICRRIVAPPGGFSGRDFLSLFQQLVPATVDFASLRTLVSWSPAAGPCQMTAKLYLALAGLTGAPTGKSAIRLAVQKINAAGTAELLHGLATWTGGQGFDAVLAANLLCGGDAAELQTINAFLRLATAPQIQAVRQHNVPILALLQTRLVMGAGTSPANFMTWVMNHAANVARLIDYKYPLEFLAEAITQSLTPSELTAATRFGFVNNTLAADLSFTLKSPTGGITQVKINLSHFAGRHTYSCFDFTAIENHNTFWPFQANREQDWTQVYAAFNTVSQAVNTWTPGRVDGNFRQYTCNYKNITVVIGVNWGANPPRVSQFFPTAAPAQQVYDFLRADINRIELVAKEIQVIQRGQLRNL